MTVESSPTARALRALELLQGNPGMTATRLGERLGVTERAARRYVGVLREAGIPIESVRGPYGGYRVGRGLRLPPVVFSGAEALGLVMAALDGHHDTNDPGTAVGSGLAKLVRALPPAVAAQAEMVRSTAAAAPDRGAARPDPEITAALVQACADRRQVRVAYRPERGSPRDLDVDPWAVVVRHGRWYLVCRAHHADAVRTYRVDRVAGCTTLETTFTATDGLDAVAVLEEHLAVGWPHDVDVLIDAPAGAVRPWLPRALGRVEPDGTSRCRLVATTNNPEWYAQQLAVVPAAFHVRGGPELRAAVATLGQRLLDAVGAAPERTAAPPTG